MISSDEIKQVAKKHGWDFLCYQENNYMLSFTKPGMRINVWPSRMTVATCLDHPKQGKTQLFRRHVNLKLLERIFEYPRVHTMKGYQTK